MYGGDTDMAANSINKNNSYELSIVPAYKRLYVRVFVCVLDCYDTLLICRLRLTDIHAVIPMFVSIHLQF